MMASNQMAIMELLVEVYQGQRRGCLTGGLWLPVSEPQYQSHSYIEALCGLHNSGWITVSNDGHYFRAKDFGLEQYHFQLDEMEQML